MVEDEIALTQLHSEAIFFFFSSLAAGEQIATRRYGGKKTLKGKTRCRRR